ncbi:hypothetical protein N7494_005386 [Penicillium frequentans]|uniref:Ankyrin repeat protein n=1 Tax=Penicillium frequentans TaxID=3151616 RepID=A0AAD6CZ92_9EURO|nr:hypothetical protein N7494_005386 [Penicillium glabrum]
MHIAAVDNNIDALKLFKSLGANMNCLGEVWQTPAEIALCNGTTYRSSGALLSQHSSSQRSEIWQKLSLGDIVMLYSEGSSKLADIWAKKIGLETLRGLVSIIATPLFKSVEKLLKIIKDYLQRLDEPNEVRLRDVDDIKDILNKFLNQVYPDEYLTHLAYYLAPKLAEFDIEHLRSFVNSKIGRALHLGKCSFAEEEKIIWVNFNEAIDRISRER